MHGAGCIRHSSPDDLGPKTAVTFGLNPSLMIEKQNVNGRDVWIQVDPQPVQRENPNIIPTEYFTATCFSEDPSGSNNRGEEIRDEDGKPKLFESPVAALTYARKAAERMQQ